ncbi:MAG: Histone-like transcription factor and archaeal histone [Candidatus Woesearchaeota archaeon]|nr:Histone-like transcription factor and archaeal histone [Candidatus Woesearchaeota archaeon]MDN5328204.1 Histone-like transcription factor and archaeal histone [Candidatus Woesearchaeota archaeon]
MPKNKQAVPVLPIKKLVNEKGFRISKDAAKALSDASNQLIEEIIKEVLELKEVEGGKTIQVKDIELAIKLIENE